MKSQSGPEPSLIWATALLPVVTVGLCYGLSAAQAFIPSCLPNLDGCTSISSTGRHGAAYWLFKLGMLPQAFLLYRFWGALAHQVENPRTLRGLGRIGATFLVIYVIFLGADNDVYRLMRRYGVFVFFIGTFAAMSVASYRLFQRRERRSSSRVLLGLCVAMFVLGLMEAPLGKFGLGDNQAENLIEWNFALLMQGWFLVLWWHFSGIALNRRAD